MTKLISEKDMKEFAVTGKLGLISTVSGEYPHITLISSIQAKDEKTIMWGQFTQGISKTNLQKNPKSGFMVVSVEKKWWRGLALYKGATDTGEDFDMYNNQPLFRYNSYFGIEKIHYMDVVNFSGEQPLPIGGIVKGALWGRAVKPFVKPCSDGVDKIFNLSVKLLKNMMSLKFLSYFDKDEFPRLLPVLQSVMKDRGRVIIPFSAYGEELRQIEKGQKIALFIADLELNSVLLQGEYKGSEKKGGMEYGIFDIEKVYNSMLPVVGYIYPMEEYKLVH